MNACTWVQSLHPSLSWWTLYLNGVAQKTTAPQNFSPTVPTANLTVGDFSLTPSPAGQVAVLLAAQLLLQQFVAGNRASSVGIVTADTAMAISVWNQLEIATMGGRDPP